MTSSKAAVGSPWSVNSRTVVFGAIGAALYGALGVFSFIIPGTSNVAVRPALAIVPFVGIRFGPIAGLFTGLVGNAVVDQIQGFGFLTFWNWGLANGLIGLFAALLAHYLPEPSGRSGKAVRLVALTAVAVVAGLVFTVTEVLFGQTVVYWFTGGYLPAVLTTGLVSLLLVPVLDRAWQPLARHAGR
ncbi:ECF transporter S component [Nocardia paucivorans]|uniref:ECF transporter S component n=1 Tax=Nocardia paucivorans TaxID=114259 RepID=UPI0002F02117|nr:ECF transporter S component [Nocardia paucivorans]